VNVADKVRMIAPHLTVLMDDGAIHEVQANNFDMLLYERTARKRGWPGPQDAQVEWCTFLAWHGLKREGTIPPDVTYDAFAERCLSIDPSTSAVDPSPPVPETG
jgi:hypothetical protein